MQSRPPLAEREMSRKALEGLSQSFKAEADRHPRLWAVMIYCESHPELVWHDLTKPGSLMAAGPPLAEHLIDDDPMPTEIRLSEGNFVTLNRPMPGADALTRMTYCSGWEHTRGPRHHYFLRGDDRSLERFRDLSTVAARALSLLSSEGRDQLPEDDVPQLPPRFKPRRKNSIIWIGWRPYIRSDGTKSRKASSTSVDSSGDSVIGQRSAETEFVSVVP